jgi:DNA helicase-2/ATP-dependent DNA helicase PcrA
LRHYSKAIVAKLLKPQNEALLAKNIRLEPSTVLSLISKAKSKGYTIDDVLAQERDPPPSDIDNAVNSVWAEYEQILRKSNSLDFDDLLLFGNTLFTQHPEVVRWCRHVLVDELCAFFR